MKNEIMQDLKTLGLTQFAKVKKNYFATIDNLPPLAAHDWLKITKNSIVGLFDDISDINFGDKNGFYTVHTRIRVYAKDNNTYRLVSIPYDYLEILK